MSKSRCRVPGKSFTVNSMGKRESNRSMKCPRRTLASPEIDSSRPAAITYGPRTRPGQLVSSEFRHR